MAGDRIFSRHYWLTVKDVERLLDWHRSKIRRWMKQGKLPFVRDVKGYARFPRPEIERLAQERLGRVVHGAPARVAAKAFGWFAEGKTWQEVVVLLGREGEAQPVEVVQKLHAQFFDEGRRSASDEGGTRARASETDVGDVDDDEMTPEMDADTWRREQQKEARRAQEALEHEERAWEQERRRQEEERVRRYPALLKASLPETPAEESAPLSERFVTMLQLLAAQKASG